MQRAGCLTAATLPSLFRFDSSEANENQAQEVHSNQGRKTFLVHTGATHLTLQTSHAGHTLFVKLATWQPGGQTAKG